MTTERQMAANQANALKSTGPKTPEGKAAIRLNALKDGLLASDVFISAGVGKEDADEYATLLDDLRACYDPVGRMEFIQVERIAIAYWRLRRVARAEVGALRRNRDGLEARLDEASEEEFRSDLAYLHHDLGSSDHDSNILDRRESRSDTRELGNITIRRRLRTNPSGVQHLLTTIAEAIDQLERTHKLDVRMEHRLHLEFAGGEQSLPVSIFRVTEGKRRRSELSSEDQGVVLRLLREEKVELQALLVRVEQRRQEVKDVAIADTSLPNDRDMERILRYESMRDRQLNQAMMQLERLQRHRMEEVPSPTLHVEVTTQH